MTRSILVTATQPHSGKTTVALGLVHSLRSSFSKVGYFKPVVSASPDGIDPDVRLMKDALGLDFPMEEMGPVTMSQVKDSLANGTYDQLLDTILDAFEKLAAQCDFVVCEGTDYCDAIAAFEFDINADISKNLGCPVVLVADRAWCAGAVEDCSTIKTIAVAKRSLEAKGCDMVGTVLNRANPDRTKAINECATTNLKKMIVTLFGTVPYDRTLLEARKEGETSVVHAYSELAKSIVASSLDVAPLIALATAPTKSPKTTPKQFIHRMMSIAKRNKQRIVLPEGKEPRILQAAQALLERGIVDLTLLGNEDEIRQQIDRLDLMFDDSLQIIDPQTSEWREPFAKRYVELRGKKAPTMERAMEIMSDVTYFGTMMVQEGHANGMVSGSITTTAATLRPAFEFVKTKPGCSIASSVFFMCLPDQVLVYGDCAVNPSPTAEQLADIAVASAETAASFDVQPYVAMLSYSTGTSGTGADVDKVVRAKALVKERVPDLLVEGPIQYDAAIDPGVAKTKLPNSKVAGAAKVFIFPDLDAGNIAYKAVQRASNATAIGPVMQGLRKPVNDLSRGCTIPDIINTIAITAIQAQRS